jgi:ABC-type branched-subunit amino acid transport system ATPase component
VEGHRSFAGKTTTLKTLMEWFALAGRVALAGVPTQDLRPHAIANLATNWCPRIGESSGT